MTDDLRDLRARLDEVDGAIVDALVARLGVIQEVAQLKAAGAQALRDRSREETLLARVVDRGRRAGIDTYFLTRVFREILDHSLRLQQQHVVAAQNPDVESSPRVMVGYQGAEGAYSHIAATRHFGSRPNARFKPYDSLKRLIEAVRERELDYALLPIENTTAGSINETYDLLAHSNVALVGEEVQRADHCLLALDAVPVSHIRRIYSHPQALAECSEFLASLTDCHVESCASTAEAAARVRDDQNLSHAAIASEDAAHLYELAVVRRDLADHKENFTRFVVIAARPMRYDARIPCKTSLVFATRHEEGALLSCLNILAGHHLNLTKLESRPRPNAPWEYLFYVDFEGNVEDAPVQEALTALTARTSFLKVLGSYPARTTRDVQPAEPRPESRTPSPRVEVPAKPAPLAPAVVQVLEKAPYKLVSRAGRLEDTIVRVGAVMVGGARPIVMAGPCSVESREQIMACARAAREAGVDILRGGCFKPRTSPYAFQGLGYEALDLLAEAGKEYGLPIVTEVLHPADIEEVARKADVIQIGARNMQNFALLKELGRVDRPILFKRGMMASIDEWLGAAEYLLAHGNSQVILCERGIRSFETATRNTLDISAVPVVRERTHLPIIVDPSHACGVRRWVTPLGEAAIACGAHGLMVEFHPDPERALSDGPQALTFEGLHDLMRRVHSLGEREPARA